MRLSFLFALPGVALALAGSAQAQQQTKSATFRVSATVVAACEVNASDLDFGPDTSRTGSGATGSVAVRCAPETAYSVGLNAGKTPGATVNQRQMLAGANPLNYQLYQDAGRRKIWGNTIGTDTVPGAGTGQSVDHTIFGAVPARRVIPAGEYGDTVTVQVYF
jgi:spore coat protein U-like protein